MDDRVYESARHTGRMLTKTETVEAVAASVADKEWIVAMLREDYGLVVSPESVFKFLEKTASSHVYRAVVSDGRTVVIKRSFWYTDPKANYGAARVALETAYEVSESLAARGVPLPRLFVARGRGDSRYVVRAGRDFVSVFQFCEGEHFSGQIAEFRSVGEALGIFHREGRVLGKKIERRILADIPVEKPYEDSRALWDTGLRETLLAAHKCAFPAVCGAFRDNIALIEKTMELVDASGVNAPERVRGLVHNDFHVNNGLYRPDGSFSCFLDIDQVSVAPLVWDIGNTLVSLISNFVTREGSESDIEKVVREFFRGYRREHTIPHEELLLIVPAGLRWDLLRLLRSLCRHRFENDRLSGLYDKIATRIIPRFKRIPALLSFITPNWFARETAEAKSPHAKG